MPKPEGLQRQLSLSLFSPLPSLSHTCSFIKFATDGSGAEVHVFYHRLSHPLKRLRGTFVIGAARFLVSLAHEPKHIHTLRFTVKHRGDNCNQCFAENDA